MDTLTQVEDMGREYLGTATYSPDDNKLRFYPRARLSADDYARIKAAGFSWAPKQELFVAGMWTPGREDLLTEWCGEVGDEDTSLVDRAEERAERFDEYSEKRAADADRAHATVASIVEHIPLGQPILIGHHSERHARKDAERIRSGMNRAVKMWETSQYWQSRAAGAMAHAKYKELPAVRARRIKKIEADQRKYEKSKQESDMWLKLWIECEAEQDAELQAQVALRIANMCWLHMPRKEGDNPVLNQQPTAYDVLTNSHPTLYAPRTLAEVIERAKKVYPRSIAHCDRWLAHFANRLSYERAMLQEQGGTAADRTGPQKGGGCKCWASPRGGWSYIQKVNKVSVTVLDNWGNGGGNFTRTIPFDKLSGVMTAADVAEAREAGRLIDTEDKTGFILRDRTPEPVREAPEADPRAEKFAEMAATAKAGVQVVTAPQLFPTPRELAEKMVDCADIEPGHFVLEPSAGTGRIIGAMGGRMFGHNPESGAVVAVEINAGLCAQLEREFPLTTVHCADFLEKEWNGAKFDRILMNPPFANGADIKHIKRAMDLLRSGGKLVAICANGPRQREQLMPLAIHWEDLPAGTFAEEGTGVNTALLVIEA